MTRPASASAAGSCGPTAPRSWPVDERLGRGRAALPDLELLADAEDRPQAALDRPPELLADPLVGLGVVAPPLAVADDHPRREAGEHRRARCRRCTRPRARGGRPGRRRRRPSPRERVADGREADERRADDPRRPPARAVRAAIVAASSPASAGVVFIFQLAAMMTGRMARIMPEARSRGRAACRTAASRAAPSDPPRPACERQALDPLEGALDGRAVELEPLGELAQRRLRRLAPGRRRPSRTT